MCVCVTSICSLAAIEQRFFSSLFHHHSLPVLDSHHRCLFFVSCLCNVVLCPPFPLPFTHHHASLCARTRVVGRRAALCCQRECQAVLSGWRVLVCECVSPICRVCVCVCVYECVRSYICWSLAGNGTRSHPHRVSCGGSRSRSERSLAKRFFGLR